MDLCLRFPNNCLLCTGIDAGCFEATAFARFKLNVNFENVDVLFSFSLSLDIPLVVQISIEC